MRKLTKIYEMLVLILACLPLTTHAQINTLTIDHYCAYNKTTLPKQLITFNPDTDAKTAIEQIMAHTGLPPSFKILAADVPNAAAVIKGKQRYILYNQLFMSRIKNSTKTDWSQVSILAHEIGHHLSNHTLAESGSRPKIELEAGVFSGHVLQKMGASMEEAVAAIKAVADEKGSRTHPPRRQRIASIVYGWKKAADQGRGNLPAPGQTSGTLQFKRETAIKSDGKVEHLHNGRPHAHRLPATGIHHQHGKGSTTRHLPRTISLAHNMKLMKIDAGSFQMGSQSSKQSEEQPVHTVAILNPFWLSKTEVTFEQYDAYATATRWAKPNDAGWGRGNRPVINVARHEAQQYVEWLSETNERGLQCLLPSEEEWKYVARSKKNQRYGWGDTIGNKRANCHGCGSQWDNKQTAPVGSFPAVGFGINDMHGNVAEWTQDRWHKNYQGAPVDGSAWKLGGDTRGVVRGGSWNLYPDELRSSFRYSIHPNQRNNYTGFRVLCTPQ